MPRVHINHARDLCLIEFSQNTLLEKVLTCKKISLNRNSLLEGIWVKIQLCIFQLFLRCGGNRSKAGTAKILEKERTWLTNAVSEGLVCAKWEKKKVKFFFSRPQARRSSPSHCLHVFTTLPLWKMPQHSAFLWIMVVGKGHFFH